MFYTILSKLPVIQDSNKKILMIFILGSLFYVLLSYYLYSDKRSDMIEKFKPYFYYLMVVDFGLAYFLTKYLSNNEIDDDEQYEQNQRQLQQIEKNVRHNIIRAQRMQQLSDNNENVAKETFVRHSEKDERSEKSKKSHKSGKSHKSKSPSEKSNKIAKVSDDKKKESKKKSDDIESDTYIPPCIPE